MTYVVDSVNGKGLSTFDGYLLQIQPERGPGWVQLIAHAGLGGHPKPAIRGRLKTRH